MFKFTIILSTLLSAMPAWSGDECPTPEPIDPTFLVCRSAAKISVGINAQEVPTTPKLSINVFQNGDAMTAQIYQPTGGCSINSAVQDVQLSGSKTNGQCVITLSNKNDSKKLELKMTVGGSDQLIYLNGENVTRQDIHNISCETDFLDEFTKKYCS